MTNVIYPKAREAWAQGKINWGTGSGGDTIKVTLVSTGYTYNAAHEFLSSVPSSATRVATATLTGKTVSNGTLDANDVTFPAVTGNQASALIIWKDTGNESTSRLLMYLDTVSSGLPVVPNGGAINLVFHTNGIAVL